MRLTLLGLRVGGRLQERRNPLPRHSQHPRDAGKPAQG